MHIYEGTVELTSISSNTMHKRKGIIKSIKRSEGYGFVETEEGERVFFHQRWLKKAKFRDLHEGDKVVFAVNQGPRGLRANHLSLAGDEEEAIKVERGQELFK